MPARVGEKKKSLRAARERQFRSDLRALVASWRFNFDVVQVDADNPEFEDQKEDLTGYGRGLDKCARDLELVLGGFFKKAPKGVTRQGGST